MENLLVTDHCMIENQRYSYILAMIPRAFTRSFPKSSWYLVWLLWSFTVSLYDYARKAVNAPLLVRCGILNIGQSIERSRPRARATFLTLGTVSRTIPFGQTFSSAQFPSAHSPPRLCLRAMCCCWMGCRDLLARGSFLCFRLWPRTVLSVLRVWVSDLFFFAAKIENRRRYGSVGHAFMQKLCIMSDHKICAVVWPLGIKIYPGTLFHTDAFAHVKSNSHKKYFIDIDARGLTTCHFTKRILELLCICRYLV